MFRITFYTQWTKFTCSQNWFWINFQNCDAIFKKSQVSRKRLELWKY